MNRVWVLLLLLTTSTRVLSAAGPVLVEASDLAKRTDLIGREVLVDDRFLFFVFHKGKGYDEVVLRRAEAVTFHLAQNLRPVQAPRPGSVRLQGILEKRGTQLAMEVQAMELLPPDIERLEAGVAAATAQDFEKRVAWARWASARADSFNDEPLKLRARQVAADALWIEASRGSDAERTSRSLALAQRGRKENVAEPIPGALAHRAFRTRLSSASSIATLDSLTKEVEEFFPEARQASATPVPLKLEKGQDAGQIYRDASSETRTQWDRALLADTIQASLERQFSQSPAKGLELADRARLLLPDRPQVSGALQRDGLTAAASDVGKLSLREVKALSARYRDEMRQPQQARDLLRKWLDDRRANRLSATDSDGRFQLARQYDELLNDRTVAVQLLRAALVIDPQSKDVSDMFRRFGYRKVDEAWVEPSNTTRSNPTETAQPANQVADALVSQGMTREQVRTRLGGKPDRIVRVATQGEVLEQWIYQGAKGTQIVNFGRGLDRPEPRVAHYFTLP